MLWKSAREQVAEKGGLMIVGRDGAAKEALAKPHQELLAAPHLLLPLINDPYSIGHTDNPFSGACARE